MDRYETENLTKKAMNDAALYEAKFAFALDQISEHSNLRKRACDYVFGRIYDDVDRNIMQNAKEGHTDLFFCPPSGMYGLTEDGSDHKGFIPYASGLLDALADLAQPYQKAMIEEHNNADEQFITETVAEHYRNEGYTVNATYTDRNGMTHNKSHSEMGADFYQMAISWGTEKKRNTPRSYVSIKEESSEPHEDEDALLNEAAEKVFRGGVFGDCFRFERDDNVRKVIEKYMDDIWDNASEEDKSEFMIKRQFFEKGNNNKKKAEVAWYAGFNCSFAAGIWLSWLMVVSGVDALVTIGAIMIPAIVIVGIIFNVFSGGYGWPSELWDKHLVRKFAGKKALLLTDSTT